MSISIYVRRIFLGLLLISAVACAAEEDTQPTFHEEENPNALSDWGMFSVREKTMTLADNVIPYDIATPLFSDYALKLRTIWLPDGTQSVYNPDEAFDMPVGTVITKTFYYPTADTKDEVTYNRARTVSSRMMDLHGLRLIETRILTRRESGWDAVAYLWNDEQTDAYLKRTGAIIPLTLNRPDERSEDFAYLVPNVNQCAGCHATNATTKAIKPIGIKARHLNKQSSFAAGFNQLDHWIAKGLLTAELTDEAPRNADWLNFDEPLDRRARAYLDANCSHCHNPNGPADTSGLDLEPDATGASLGICKTPIAAGTGTGGRIHGIVPGDPDRSILVYRMETNDPGAMMPELGRGVTHEEGVGLIREWIAQMDGACGT
ncbi:SO2930 family diheme c-type cytochrome [Hyphococcus sp. DH-69]|uniref:SO2930 family diheme c-type cytochrome n=1 Tax=Hyphococcus formosus TaxID=3143534 RepID=UPI00398B6CF9